MSRRCFALALLLPSLLVSDRPARAAEAEPPQTKLAVLVVFDQMRGDYLKRWDALFGEGGFHRLTRDGAWFQECHYPYAHTVTGAGHASVLTGCWPWKHGIIANEWYDRAVGEQVYCATTDRYQRVPPPAGADGKKKKQEGGNPDRLLSPTLGDALKAATGGKGRVVALSLKDRGAVLPGGKKADACYWFDASAGIFITSTYYRDRQHPWAEEYNRGRPADRWFGKPWQRLRADLDYARYSGPDDVPGEGRGVLQGRVFPHRMTGGLKEPGRLYYEALYNSPFGNELLLGLVKAALAGEKLGTRDTPDLLAVSFSCNDPIGHCWGPDSQEVMDVTLRSDLIVKELLTLLDAQVGKGRYSLVLTVDHGVCPLAEVARAQGHDADRLPTSLLKEEAEEFLEQTYGRGGWVKAAEHPWVYLNQSLIKERGLKAADVEAALAGWLVKQPGIQAAYTRTQLLAGVPADDAIGRMVRRSFHPDRAGDVAVVVKPYYQITQFLTGTGHGTPHPYDTHVPLLVYGPGVKAGVRKDRVAPQAAATILAHALGIKPPADAEVPLPDELFAPKEKE